jgi:hypothetical protein
MVTEIRDELTGRQGGLIYREDMDKVYEQLNDQQVMLTELHENLVRMGGPEGMDHSQ